MSQEKPNPMSKGLTPEVREQLKALGIPVKAWDPNELEAVVRGHRTLGELAGISKERQYELQAMGLKFLQDGLRDKALDVFNGLEALDPYDAYVQACLGTIAFQEEDFEAALERFDRALFYNPSSVPALAYRGELKLRQGHKAEAIADLERAVSSTIKGNEELISRARALLEAAKK
jgi:tetratricopeptide (TPR) repeat protein